MADKLLICISAGQASAAHWTGSKIAECRIFTHDDDGIAAFREFLAPFSTVPVYFMVDAVEEDYRFETLPHTYGSDRVSMVGRKLKQHYRNLPYTAAWLQGRESGKRRDDRYLFSALTNTDLVAAWLQAVTEKGLPVAGIYLLPMVSMALLDKLQIRAPNLLVVAQHSAGLRLSFFRNRQFRLSRLTRSDNDTIEAADRTRFIAEEISNTRLYLHALRITTLDEPLMVLLLDRQDEFGDSAQVIAHDNPGLSCQRLGRAEIAAQLGISDEQIGLSRDVIYLYLLGLKAPASNLASAAITSGFRHYSMRRGVYAATAAVALAAAAWGGVNTYLLMDTNAQALEASRQTTQQQVLYQEATRQFPAAPASSENLKKAVEVAQKLRESARTPETMMGIISTALGESPAITIREFAWKYSPTEIESGGTAGRSAGESAALAGAALPRKQSGLIEGEVRPFRGDYRAAIDTINDFAGRLGRDPGVQEARVVKLPLNVNPTLALSGNTLDSREQAGTAEFRILIVLKARNP
ncbi:MAG: hypothetical protein Q8K18_09290 [Burkholderiales bacterium]|nr:hypothetical protein [Burkholderiales bacterium]